MTERTLGMPRRTPTEWFSTLPTLLLLLIVVFLSSGQTVSYTHLTLPTICSV